MVASIESPKVASIGTKTVTLNPQQEAFCNEFLEWLELIPNRLKTLCGFAGTGKSFTIKHALIQAHQQGLLHGGQVVACAPTHQAKAILQRALEGAPVDQVSTSHSLLQLRPKMVEFNAHDDERLETLLSISKDDRSSDETALIDWLQVKQAKAAEQIQEFVSQGTLSQLKNVRLIIVDEAGMVDSYMFGLFCNLLDNPDPNVEFHPDLQILFMGDPAQLPPINETLGKAFTLPLFTELTQVMRYKGAILEYCNGVRVDTNYETLHRRISEDETLLCLPSYEVFAPEVLKDIYESDTVRFVASTNKRVAELNYIIRSLLKNDESQNALFYEPGDTILTMAAVQHDTNGYYDIGCSARKAKLEINTSTLIELGDPVLPGEVVGFENGYSTMVSNRSLEHKSALGTTFRRLIYRYRVYASGDPFSDTKAICLIDPEQFALWKDECDRLLRRAKSTQSRGKSAATARGQNGETAEEVWAANGMKNWDKWLDGSVVHKGEYERIKNSLWHDYFNLVQFADNASFSYASTAHRCQGATVDVVVVDINDILGGRKRKPEGESTWDTRKLLYTAASRAAKQLVFLV